MFNALIYKVCKRGQVPTVSLYINFNGSSSVETALQKEFSQGVRIDLITFACFDTVTIFDCMIVFAEHITLTHQSVRECNQRLLICLNSLEKHERKKHCLGFIKWKEFLCQHYRQIYPMNPFGATEIKFRNIVKSLKTL
jgi:hypothetical protein